MNRTHMTHTILAALFAAFFMYAAYHRGLYFEQDFTPLHVLLDACGLLVLLYLWLRGEVRSYIGLFALFLMGGVYLLPLLFTRVSVGGTLEQIMHWGSYATWLLLVYLFAKRVADRRLLHGVFGAVGLFIGLGMFAGFYGLFSFQDLYLISQDERFTALGVRFSGFFQYANTFAIVMGAFLLYHLVHLAKENRKWATSLIAAPLVMYGVAILLSESRGSWLVLGVGWLAGLWVLTATERRRYLLLTLLLGCAVLLAYQNFVSEFLQKGTHLPGLVMLVCATLAFLLVAVGLLYAESRFVIEANKKRWLYGAFATVAVLVSAGLVWKSTTLLNRGLHHFESAVARKLFYRDAVTMYLDSPWIGWGGSGWRMLFHQYQQYPYVGNEVHSGLISIGLDVGLVGAIVFCLVFYRYLVRIVVSKSPVVPALLVLLGHSLFDVDMSFGFFWFLVLWLIGTNLANVEAPFMKKRKPSRLRDIWQKHGVVAASMALLMLCMVCAVHYEMGNRAFTK
ncbi:MAG: O-antigen ligase family protein, partial [Tumebacillaceae bacterium]